MALFSVLTPPGRGTGPDEAPLLSILIPTWNNLEYLQACIRSLRTHSQVPHEIIVHVNEGTDGTAAWAASEQGLVVTYSETNIGVCLSVNAMLSVAAGRYVVYFNDDMYALPDWDSSLVSYAERMPSELFMLSSTMIEPRGHNNAAVAPADYGADLEHFQEERLLREYPSLKRPDWRGSTWPPTLMRRSSWLLVGGYSVEFSPGFGSDPDLSRKMWEIGCRDFTGVGSSLVYHFMCRTTGRIKRNDGSKTFRKKWGQKLSYFVDKTLKRGEPFGDGK